MVQVIVNVNGVVVASVDITQTKSSNITTNDIRKGEREYNITAIQHYTTHHTLTHCLENKNEPKIDQINVVLQREQGYYLTSPLEFVYIAIGKVLGVG